MNANLQQVLKQLRLSGLAESLDVRLQEAASQSLSHAEFLELILEDELAVRRSRAIDRRLKHANFREMKALEDWALPERARATSASQSGGQSSKSALPCCTDPSSMS